MNDSNRKPNVIVILADDMGYSDIGCFGGIIETPNLDRLAQNGVRLTEFYNTARCSPSRASLLTGLHPHQAGMAHLQGKYGPYTQQLSDNCVTIAEALKNNGYETYMSGKWHAGIVPPHERGFNKAMVYPGGNYYNREGISLNGEVLPAESIGDDYFSTDHMTDTAVEMLRSHLEEKPEEPFLLYMAYTAPHFPLHAKESDISKYKGRFDKGWEILRQEKYERMKEMGLIDPSWELSPMEASATEPWSEEPHKEWRLRAMEVYAAMIDCMDQNIGKLLDLLEQSGQLDNSLIMFLSDNGGNGEFPVIKNVDVLPGGSDFKTEYGHYGYGWANLSNTPFRMFKHYIHEGGIASPFIVHWPSRLEDKGSIKKTPVQLPDIMATILAATDTDYPKTFQGNTIIPLEGVSMLPIFENAHFEKEYLFWEHEGNCGVRHGDWKLVKFHGEPWELYDKAKDGTELYDLVDQFPDIVSQLDEHYEQWRSRSNVLTHEEYEQHSKNPGFKGQVADINIVKQFMATK